jgi:hypothetical protein
MSSKGRVWLARLLVLVVTVWNLQAALVFLARPQVYAPGFMLAGVPGETAVRGVGVLFVMWSIPYLVAIWHPARYRLALGLALAMQITGVLGECLVLAGVPVDFALLRSSLLRFIVFDFTGVLLLAGAYFLVRKEAPYD